jgi:tartronate-semialdehyde synthase
VLIDLPIDVQTAEIEFDLDMYEPLAVFQDDDSCERRDLRHWIACATADNRLRTSGLESGGGVLR